MKEHYATRLKKEIERLQNERSQAVETLKHIALGKVFDPCKAADAALRKLGLIGVCFDVNAPPDRVYLGKGGNLPVSDYI